MSTETGQLDKTRENLVEYCMIKNTYLDESVMEIMLDDWSNRLTPLQRYNANEKEELIEIAITENGTETGIVMNVMQAREVADTLNSMCDYLQQDKIKKNIKRASNKKKENEVCFQDVSIALFKMPI